MAIYELGKKDFHKISEIFQPISRFQPLCSAVIGGIQPGRIFIDHKENPQAGVINTWENWCFLAGRPEREFIKSARMALFDHTIANPPAGYLLFTVDEEAWSDHLDTLFHPRHPIPVERRHYTADRIELDCRAALPEGFIIIPLARDLLELPDLPEEVKETLTRWQAADHPRIKDFGFVVMHQGGIAAWATVDAIFDGAGDIGMVTQEPFRRKGLAAAVSAAAAQHAFEIGVKQIHWTCQERNIGSIKTAEKLGFVYQGNYTAYYFEYDELWDLIQYAGVMIDEENYSQGLSLCEQAIDLAPDPPQALLIYTSRAQAMLEKYEQAIGTLRSLLKAGWTDVEFLKNDVRLKGLHETIDWHDLLITANSQQPGE
jgi:RimJ/RimL family protein N-acetyltransferase